MTKLDQMIAVYSAVRCPLTLRPANIVGSAPGLLLGFVLMVPPCTVRPGDPLGSSFLYSIN